MIALLLLQVVAQATPLTPTKPWVPPMAVGNEADAKQLALARRQGAAYAALVDWEGQGAAWSASTEAADYRLVAAISPAAADYFRGWWERLWACRTAAHGSSFDISDLESS